VDYNATPERPASVSYRALFLIAALALLASSLWRSLGLSELWLDIDTTPRVVTPRGSLAADEQSTIELFEAASPAVVHINTRRRVRNFFTRNLEEIPEGSGSGFLWDDAGHVVTNFHVIRGADSALITLKNHNAWEAKLVGYDQATDLAVLRIMAPTEDLQPIALGSSSDLRVGQKVFAIGNPFGLDQTLTTGVISGLDREIMSVGGYPIQDVIQTDAAINPGNSGGALLDSAGRLIGVNTAILSPAGTSAGVGFAVPADTVNHIVPRIIRMGQKQRAGLGVDLVDSSSAGSLGLKSGLLIIRVSPGSAAERAGLRQTVIENGRIRFGDVILGMDGRAVNQKEDLLRLLDEREVGETVELQIDRDGEAVELSIQLMAIG